jgi:hypothetical protein
MRSDTRGASGSVFAIIPTLPPRFLSPCIVLPAILTPVLLSTYVMLALIPRNVVNIVTCAI